MTDTIATAATPDPDEIRRIRESLAGRLPSDIAGFSPFSSDPERLGRIEAGLRAMAADGEFRPFDPDPARVQTVLDELVGLSVLAPAFRDPSVDEIIATGPDRLFAVRDGVVARLDAAFRDAGHYIGFIERLLASEGRKLTGDRPVLKLGLGDGTTVEAIGPPITERGTYSLTIRKPGGRESSGGTQGA